MATKNNDYTSVAVTWFSYFSFWYKRWRRNLIVLFVLGSRFPGRTTGECRPRHWDLYPSVSVGNGPVRRVRESQAMPPGARPRSCVRAVCVTI